MSEQHNNSHHSVSIKDPTASEMHEFTYEEGESLTPIIEPKRLAHEKCANCAKEEGTYTSFPCKCLVYCKKCAMKMATGGICKKCHTMFASMALLK